MTDPRYTDPPTDPRFRDPVLRDDTSRGGAMWGWIAGIAVLILIVFVLIGGWNGSGTNTASNAPNNPAATTTGSAPGGAMAPRPATPAPAPAAKTPAPAPAGK
ncbi:MAG TPA: hypothetical protein VIJ67_12025 [Pseudolabrys sp.]